MRGRPVSDGISQINQDKVYRKENWLHCIKVGVKDIQRRDMRRFSLGENEMNEENCIFGRFSYEIRQPHHHQHFIRFIEKILRLDFDIKFN